MSNQKDDVQPQANGTQPTQPVSGKRPYHAPTLRAHGNISQHTLANSFFIPAGDGGTGFPNVYAS